MTEAHSIDHEFNVVAKHAAASVLACNGCAKSGENLPANKASVSPA